MKPHTRKLLFDLLMAVLFVGLCLFIVYGCGPKSEERKPEAVVEQPKPSTLAVLMDGMVGASKIAWLKGQLAAAQEEQKEKDKQANKAITDSQVTWATWAAGLTFLLGGVMLALSFVLGIPKKFGVIGMVIGASLLVLARVWGSFAKVSPIVGNIALAGGALVVLYVLYTNRDVIRAKLDGKTL